MSILLNGDCLDEMKELDDDSIDLIFCDLPYGQTSCKWDCKIDLQKFWIEIMRIKKTHTPIFMTTTTKFGVDLINTAPKKCPFRYDLVWVKSAPAGFLSAKKMPMRKHEMIYVFYEKLPLYDLSSHTHKFVREKPSEDQLDEKYKNKGGLYSKVSRNGLLKTEPHYNPPLPTSVIKGENNTYNTEGRKKPITREKAGKYNPPLPTSVVKEEGCYGDAGTEDYKGYMKGSYNPPLPTSVVKEPEPEPEPEPEYITEKDSEYETCYGDVKIPKHPDKGSRWNPPLPTSVVKEPEPEPEPKYVGQPVMRENTTYGDIISYEIKERKNGESRYDPPLPTTMLEIKSTRGKHSTEKPVALMEWILKYFSKEGDVVLDPTMGSGSTGVACRNMKRNFIGIELDPEIYGDAVNRIEED